MQNIQTIFSAFGLEKCPITQLRHQFESDGFVSDCTEFVLQDNSGIGGDKLIGIINLHVDYDYLENAIRTALNSGDILASYQDCYRKLLKETKEGIELDNHNFNLVTISLNNDELMLFIDQDLNVVLAQLDGDNIAVQDAIETISNLSIVK
ncbi:hypothetical protein [Vibrio alginolyticus]|uniref:hypothetical protein n=1 Tax=Vibrio alginolyticus TaxID=663 RepID=UPI0015F65C9F|nr:hypothetical protein [Vibrio alginolyticus]